MKANSFNLKRRRSGSSCGGGLGCIGLLLLLAAVVLGLYFYPQEQIHRAVVEKYPPPGQMLDVNGAKMHLYCQGQGSRTVVIETGLPAMVYWWGIQKQLAQTARVCLYDHKGAEWSDNSWQPRTAQNLTADLHALLHAAGIKPGFILVGEEVGSSLARYYTWRYPGEVGSLVLVEDIPMSPANYTLHYAPINSMILLPALLKSFGWWKDGLTETPMNCTADIDPHLCQIASGIAEDARLYQTIFAERFLVGLTLNSLLAPGVSYGKTPILILATEKGYKDLSKPVYDDIVARTNRGEVRRYPDTKNYVLSIYNKEHVDFIVRSVRSIK